LDNERAELSKNIERLKEKLDKAESLVFSMGTPEAIRQKGPVMGTSAELFPRLFSSSSQDDHNKVGAPDGVEQNPDEPVDLSVSPTEPGDTVMETSTARVVKLSFKEITASVHKQNKAFKNSEGIAGATEQPPPPKLIILSNLGSRKEDTMGKRTRSLGSAANEPAQKKPPQNSLAPDRDPEPDQDPPWQFVHEIRTGRKKLKMKLGDLVRTFSGNVDHYRRTLITGFTI
jgi:hypothetical protein